MHRINLYSPDGCNISRAIYSSFLSRFSFKIAIAVRFASVVGFSLKKAVGGQAKNFLNKF
jgi:hypothetical protein